MNEENTKYMIEHFPKLYRYVTEPTNPIISAAFGFQHGDGWFDILVELSATLEAWNDTHEADEWIYVSGIKEKYGRLVFDCGVYTDEQMELIEKAEQKSVTICEECGKKGKINDDIPYYIQTLCKKCANKRYIRRQENETHDI